MRELRFIKYMAVVIAIAGVFMLPGSVSALDDDGDSVDTSVENTAPNSGDNNYDGGADAEQDTVASIPNPNDIATPGAYVTLQVGDTTCYDGDYAYPCKDSAWEIDEFKAVDVATLPSQPNNTVFPVGMFDIKLSCIQNEQVERSSRFIQLDNGGCVEYTKVETEEGCEWVPEQIPANLKLIFDRVMDTTNWTTQKYDPTTDSYIDYSPYVTISTQNIGYLRTVVEWMLYDGGLGDSDGVHNGYISDPIGPTVPVVTKASTPEVLLASAPGKTLANTGVDSSIIVLLGIALIASGALLLPKKN